MKKLFLPLAAVVALGAATTASSALADGSCGANYTLTTACPLTSAGAFSGTLVNNAVNGDWPNGGENDYYKFYATKGTTLSVTITDTYPCAIPPVESVDGPWSPDGRCGTMLAYMDISDDERDRTGISGYGVGDGNVNYTLHTGTPFTATIPGTGTWYVVVDGSPAFDDTGTIISPTPYTVNVTVTAGSIQWPAPADTTPPPTTTPPPPPTTTPPPATTPPVVTPPVTTAPTPVTPPKAVYCVVPRYAGQTLSTVQHRLAANHCVSHVQRVKRSKVPRRFRQLRSGRVFALMSGTHTLTPGKKLAERPSGGSTVLIRVVVGPLLAETRSR
jgi:hypothetical protein